MSRWLKQVNNLLENLDDTVGDAVEQAEERLEEAAYDYASGSGGGGVGGGAAAGTGAADAEYDPSSSAAAAAAGGGGGRRRSAAVSAAVSTFAGAVASPSVRGLASKTSVDDILARRGLLDEEDGDDDVGDDENTDAVGTGPGSGDVAAADNAFGALESFGEEEIAVDDDGGAERVTGGAGTAYNENAAAPRAAAPPSGVSSLTQQSSGAQQEESKAAAASAAEATGLEPPSSSTEEEEGAGGHYVSSDPSGWDDSGNDYFPEDRIDTGETTDEGFSSAVVVDDTDGEEASDGGSFAAPSAPSGAAPPLASAATHTEPPGIDLAAAAVSKAVESAEARAKMEEMQAEMFHQANLAKKATQQAQEAEKELRKLRRHVVKLNSELEAAETEVDAQRIELERAAERMERDRSRHKEEKERAERERVEEREAALAEHKAAMDAMAARQGDRVADMEEQIRRANEAREQEGGDWNKELEDALSRERDVVKKMMALEEEKETLTNQVSTLQTQMAALQSRLESVTEVSETATERERESDDRLDAALSLHARQLSQRQAREAELERTVAELGAALAVARQREPVRGGARKTTDDIMAGDNQTSSLRAKLETAEEELETLKTQLMLEQQRSETLQQELQEITQERTEEASAVQAKQKQYDRQVADMNATISRLQTSLLDLKRTSSSVGADGGGGVGTSSSEVADLNKRVATLSQLVVQHQSKIDDGKVEISTLRTRLRTATSRAEAAEKAMTMSGNATDLSELERGSTSYVGKMRRRGVRGRSAAKAKSIRSAVKLDRGRGGNEAQEQIGSAIDVIDRWSVETGAYLRADPLARGVFLLYLVLLHLWALCLLFVHAHNDLDAGGYGVGHGPHAAMIQQSYQLKQN